MAVIPEQLCNTSAKNPRVKIRETDKLVYLFIYLFTYVVNLMLFVTLLLHINTGS